VFATQGNLLPFCWIFSQKIDKLAKKERKKERIMEKKRERKNESVGEEIRIAYLYVVNPQFHYCMLLCLRKVLIGSSSPVF
jgi:hypothetical protein